MVLQFFQPDNRSFYILKYHPATPVISA